MEGPIGLIIFSDIDEAAYIIEGCQILFIDFELCMYV
jgi:hypothetical protein